MDAPGVEVFGSYKCGQMRGLNKFFNSINFDKYLIYLLYIDSVNYYDIMYVNDVVYGVNLFINLSIFIVFFSNSKSAPLIS